MRSKSRLKATLRYAYSAVSSPLGIATAKGTIALTLLFVLILLRGFARLSPHPSAWNAAILVVITAAPGKTVGGFIETALLGLLGLAVGVGFFSLFAVLHHTPVGQAIVFALLCYGCALVRWQGTRFISFYLFSVLFAFQGIYTSIIEGDGFDASWLTAYIEAYGMGLATSFLLNIFFLPQRAEVALLALIVDSLQNIATLSHLACKTYAREITTEEKEVWKLLSSTIRHDYGLLNILLEQTSYEIVYSKFGIVEYRKIIATLQSLQQALISSSSALELIDQLDPVGVNANILGGQATLAVFSSFRHAVDLVIRDVIDQLQGTRHVKRPADGSILPQASPNISRRVSAAQSNDRVLGVQERLRQEVRHTAIRQERLREALAAETPSSEGSPASPAVLSPTASTRDVAATDLDYLKRAWQKVKASHTQEIIDVIRNGAALVADELEIKHGLPSLEALYRDQLPKAWRSSLLKPPKDPLHSDDATLAPDPEKYATGRDRSDSEAQAPISEALTKCFSLIESLSSFTDKLSELHALVSEPRSKRLRLNPVHKSPLSLLDPLRRAKEEDRVKKALAHVQGRIWAPRKRPLFSYFLRLERWLRSDHSFYAVRVALGATVYLIILLVATTRPFFVDYNVQTALITIIVAIASSAGQTLFVWILQISGTGIGSIFGLIILEIFKDRGGWSYNPYGLTVFFALWSALAAFLQYRRADWFTGALLMANGAGVTCIYEWLYAEVVFSPDQPGPALRVAHALAALCISVGISAIIQVLVFRTPARRQLRLAMARVMFELSTYNMMLQTLINAVAPADAHDNAPDRQSILIIEAALIKREHAIQEEILSLRPLLEFARLEPKYAMPFQSDTLQQIIESQQIILDRLRESRSAVGTGGFSERVHRDFASALWPYRLHSQKLSRTLFYLAATSRESQSQLTSYVRLRHTPADESRRAVLSKFSLSRDVPRSVETWASFEHDALVLSRRLSRLPGGIEELQSDGFLRYWFYLVSLGSVASELERLEGLLGVLFSDANWSHPL